MQLTTEGKPHRNCPWREGALDEARVLLADALRKLPKDEIFIKALVCLRTAQIESSAAHFTESLHILAEAAPLLENIENDSLKGEFHNELGLVLKNLANAERREDYMDRAFVEYAAAAFYFEQAGLTHYCAGVEKNLGHLYFCVNDFSKAHPHLDRARNLYFSLNDRRNVAQVDDTKARVFLAQGNNPEAEQLSRSAVRTLSRVGEQAVLAEALTTRGVALARIGKRHRSLNTFDRAIHISEVVGELEVAARARLSIIEEFYAQVPATDLVALFRSALDVLTRSPDDRTKQRMFACGMRVIEALHSQVRPLSDEVPDWENFSFRDHIIHCERVLIERALRDAGGVVSRAARLLGFKHHQSLITLLNHRHKDLLGIRSAVRPRTRNVVNGRQTAVESQDRPKIQILHVDHNELLVKGFRDYATLNNWTVTRVANAESAIEELQTHAHYDLLIFDSQLPGMNGIELVRRTRKISHRRRTPIIMFSEEDCETRAWQAGVDAFLRKGVDTGNLQSMIKRLLRPA